MRRLGQFATKDTNYVLFLILFTAAIIFSAGCRPDSPAPPPTDLSEQDLAIPPTSAPMARPTLEQTSTPPPAETAVIPIPLTGDITRSNAEISGMAWYGDWLILLPQDNVRFDGQVASRRRIIS